LESELAEDSHEAIWLRVRDPLLDNGFVICRAEIESETCKKSSFSSKEYLVGVGILEDG
jgi:hypothetical protein